MHAGADRHRIARRYRGRALSACVALVVGLAAAGCSSSANTGGNGGSSSSNTAAPIVTGEQVVTSCFQNYFDNGILPKASAQANCTSCVVQQLSKLGIKPATGENVMDMLTGDRLSNSAVQTLQGACDESDANAQ